MNEHLHLPQHLSPEELDSYLARGWYRMGQSIFTTNYIVQEEVVYRVLWLRYPLSKIHLTRHHQKLLQRNAGFKVTIKPFAISHEIEWLYSEYLRSITFSAPENVNSFLFQDGATAGSDIYDTWVIEIRDKEKLIAAGIFDKGATAVAGIMNFFDPAYKKYSPGKYLMLLKTQYAISIGKEWYYPGYIVLNYPKFDYKLFIGDEYAEVFIPEYHRWVAYPVFRTLHDLPLEKG